MKHKFKEKQSIFFRIALATLLIWCTISLIQLRVDIANLREEIEIQEQYNREVDANNEETKDIINDESNLEMYAYDKGYAKPGETIIKEVN